VPARDEQWRSNLACIAATLAERHPGAFAVTPKADFDAAVAALQAEIPQLPDAEIPVRFMRLVASLRDAHTGVFSSIWRQYPIAVERFPDGLYVVGTTADRTFIAGRRIAGVGNLGIAEVRARLAELIPQENEFTTAGFETGFFRVVEVLQGLGLTDSQDGFNLVTELPGGGTEETRIAFSTEPRVFFPTIRPPSLTRRDENYWSAVFADTRTLYIQYNVCRETPNLPMSTFAAQVRDALAGGNALRVVLDMRFNPGGNSGVFIPLGTVLHDWEGSVDPARFKILISPATASSANLNVFDIAAATGAELLGETSGNNIRSWGEVVIQALPYRALSLQHSTRFFSRGAPDAPNRLAPDRTVIWTWDDYRNGIDTVLVAAGL
jgi:hypothetical protein